MIDSGNQGGNTVLSRVGGETVVNYNCFNTIGSPRKVNATHDFGNFNIDKVPIELIKDKIKLTLEGIDKDVIGMHVENQK